MISPEEKKVIGISEKREAKLKEAYRNALLCEKEELLWKRKGRTRSLKVIIRTELEIQEEIGEICRQVFDYFEDAQTTLGRINPY